MRPIRWNRLLPRRWHALAWLLWLGWAATRTGLPQVSLHHQDEEGRFHCCCGCDCDEHPHSADSCLNPANPHVTCGCAKEHQREYRATPPRLSPHLSPAQIPQPLPSSAWTRLALPVEASSSRSVPARAAPPH